MTYEYIQSLKANHKTLKLLGSEHIAFYLSFFYEAFVKSGEVKQPHSKLLSWLDDYLFELNQTYNDAFAQDAKSYLDSWCSESNGYMRKFYDNEEEPVYELTPYAQKALEIVEGLQKREFVGSGGKFSLILRLLEELEFATSMDDTAKIERLEEKKREIDAKIARIKKGEYSGYDDTQIKESFMHLLEIARSLQYDFSEIEYNFKALNKEAMKQITLSKNEAKEDVLAFIFEKEKEIKQSDQGKSFAAFWQLVSDVERNDKMQKLLLQLYKLDIIKRIDSSERLGDFSYTLLQNANKVNETTNKLIAQLRRFIDDRVRVENKRILELVESIQKSALELKDAGITPKESFFIEGERGDIFIPFARTLYRVKEEKQLQKQLDETPIELDIESFQELFYIDEEELGEHIETLLQENSHITLGEVIEEFPVTKGVAEVVGYLSLAQRAFESIIEEQKEIITILTKDGKQKRVRLPRITFLARKER